LRKTRSSIQNTGKAGQATYNMITLADLEGAFRRERTSTALEEMKSDFFTDALALALRDDVRQYKETIEDLTESIYQLRTNKIILYACRGENDEKPPKNSLKHEAELYRNLQNVMDSNKKSVFIEKTKPEAPVQQEKKLRIRLLSPLTKIMGSDGVEYGPFKSEESVSLPEGTAKILIHGKVAEPDGEPF
jgi:DNA replication initiation complex subunit (GINS family)